MAREQLLYILLSFILIARGQVEEDETSERAQRIAEMMKHDGIERVVEMTSKNYKNFIKKYAIVVVLFHAQNNQTLYQQEKYPLEVLAKLFDKKGVICLTSNMLKDIRLSKEIGVLYPGTIKVFNHGRLTTYYGQRTPDVLVPYISRLYEPAVVNIVSKTGKKNFDGVQLPKIVAYVEKDSQEYTMLTNTARSFQPMILFHAVFDPKIAKSLQLKKINSLLFIKPFEKALKLPTSVPFKERELTGFIMKNKRQTIRKMMLENIHDIWSPEMKGYLVAVFAKIESQEGSRFFSLIKSLSKGFADNEKLNFVWIDPDPFPAMREYWQTTFNVDPTKPSMGAVDLTEQSSTWLVPPKDKELKLSDLKKWCNDLLSGKLKLIPMKGRDTSGSETAENGRGETGQQSNTDKKEVTEESSKDDSKDEL